jgi:NitT/TauT family transport system permease protein
MIRTEQFRLASTSGVALAAGVVVWWAAVVALDLPGYLLPSPVDVIAALYEMPELYLNNALTTLQTVLAGGIIGTFSGFLLGTAVAFVPLVRRAVYPYFVTVRVLPKIAVAPVLLVYFGTGFTTTVVFVALVAFFPMVVSTVSGFGTTPSAYIDLAESVDAGPVQTFLSVRLPFALPDVFAGLKQSVTLSVVGAVVAEWVVADDGLGYLILIASENVQITVLLATVLVLFVEALLLYGGVLVIQRKIAWPTQVVD